MSRYIDEHRGRFGVEPICRTLDVSASAYYARAKGRRSAKAVEDEAARGDPHHPQEELRGFGYRRTWKGAAASQGAGPVMPGAAANALPRNPDILATSHQQREPDPVNTGGPASNPQRFPS
jgi:hypothetical protein